MHPRAFAIALLILQFSLCLHADEPPVIPVGLDAYRMWGHWPYHRIGMRAYTRSTYDRSGGNEGADASHFLYQLAEDRNVTLDVEGSGILYFVRTNHWHGSPWHYTIDGTDHLVQETSTADPLHPAENSTFVPKDLFPIPLAWTWSDTKGADLMWVPMPFEKSLRLAYSRTHYGTGYYIYHQFVGGAKLSQPLKAWNGKTPPAADVLELINRSGTDIAPASREIRFKDSVDLQKSGALSFTLPTDAPRMIRVIQLSAPKDRALDLSNVRLQISWDDRLQPSVDAPVPLFFGAGTLYNRDNSEHLVKAFPMNIHFDADRVHLACYFPMPFFKSAKFTLSNAGPAIPDVRLSVREVAYTDPANHVAYFHATYRDHPTPERGKDLVLLDTQNVEGRGDWCGHFIGTSWIFSHEANLGTLEGDPRFFFDDSSTPQAQGTGTEEWGGGGDYWGGRNMSLPFAGHPTGARDARSAKSPEDKIESAYRFLLADLMPFGKNARICLEHGGTNESTQHYETVAYWYGSPGSTLDLTDELRISNAESEKSHGYVSPESSEPLPITSRYELGPDHMDGKEIYPAHTDTGRITTGASEFTLKIDPSNLGVMLRRKLDYAFPNQRAEVFIADAADPSHPPTVQDWKPAGIWYLAGSNTCYYSNPRGELEAVQHNLRTSNRRFRDDEFLLPRALTQGRSSIRVRVRFTAVSIPLFPGQPLPKLAWSEIKYSAYCFKMPP